MISATVYWHGKFSLDVMQGIQKAHHAPTPRIGGIALWLGLLAGLLVAPQAVQDFLLPIFLAATPAFVAGLAEDITKKVGVGPRFLATVASGLIAWGLTGVHLGYVQVWGLDALLAWLPFAVLFTAVAVAGIANAVNILDGFNGLASGTVIISLLAIAAMAAQVNDGVIVGTCLILVAALSGFWVLNFPLGKIFMGDGGAYLGGFLLGWLAVSLPMRHPEISPWAPLLACAFLIIETLFSILRRHCRGRCISAPDRTHLHSLIKARIVNKRLRHWTPAWQNAAVSPLVWGFAALPAAWGVLFATRTPLLWLGAMLSAMGYLYLYRSLIRFRSGRVAPL